MAEELTLDSINGIKIYQRKKGYRFSVDAVLLARYVSLPKRIKTVADLGAGSGVIGLLVAHRFGWVKVDLFEIQKGLCELAEKNAEINTLSDRTRVICTDVRKLGPEYNEHYDAVLTNPPFRREDTGIVSPYDERAVARHEITLSLPELLKIASRVLKNRGYFYIIYLADRMAELLCL
ncbi:MAG: methyltransferase domain-containing protein, partial [Nitrospirae bacterium]